jgi:hypothetical protein
LTLISLLLGASSAMAQLRLCGLCSGHFLVEQADYPYSEDIESDDVVVSSSTFQSLVSGCTANSEVNGVNYSSGTRTNAQIRGYVEIRSGSPGVRYEVRFKREDQATDDGWFVRQVKSGGFEQGEFFFSTVANVGAGRYKYHMEMRVLDPGQSITVAARWMSIQGVPADAAPGLPGRYPTDSQVEFEPYTITGNWSPAILPTITFHNTEPVDIVAQAYVEVTSGTPGDRVSFGFQLDSEPARRTSNAVVPNAIPGFATREGINITDHLESVPLGTHTLKLWAVSRSGNPVTVAARALQFISFPMDNGQNGLRFSRIQSWGPTVIESSKRPDESPLSQTGLPAGYWYAVTGEVTIPASPVENLNWTGEGYVEVLGRSGSWAVQRAEMMVETYHTTPGSGLEVTDMMWVPVTIRPGGGHIYFFTEAFNFDNRYGNKMRIWMRQAWPNAGDTFTVGEVYASMKLVPMTNGQCTYRSSSQPPPAETPTMLYTLPPCRTLDTRASTPLDAGTFRNVQISGVCGVPSGAKAAALNVTSAYPVASGTLRLYPTGIALPNIISSAYRANKARATGTVVKVSPSGFLTIYNDGPNSVHVIIDVTSYFR